MAGSKGDDIEKLGPAVNATGKPETTLREDVEAAGLQKVYERHGRVDLDPMPSDDPEDPLNWPGWKKNTLLGLVAFHTMMGPFAAASTIPAFVAFSQEFGVSITQASYITSVQILFLGVFPLLWSPISSRIGRRPVFLVSTLVSAALSFACAYCNTYGTLMAVRVLQAIAVCPPQAIGAATVTEMFFVHERGRTTGVWALFVGLGPPLAPLIMGFVVYNKSTQWIFYLLAIIFLALFVLYIFFGPETLYERPIRGSPNAQTAYAGTETTGQAWYTPYVAFRRWDRRPWKYLAYDSVAPLAMVLNPNVLLAATVYTVCFTYTNVLLTVETPALLGQKFELNAQQTGLQFIAYLIGALLGEPIAGFGSDKYMAWRTRRNNGERVLENRLPFAIPGVVLSFVGILIFFLQLNNATPLRWNVTPLIGGAIAMFGLQLVTTPCVTYAVESQGRLGPIPARRAALFTAFWRQLFAFIGPFYFPVAFESLGLSGAGGLFAALQILMVAVVVVLMLFGAKWRQKAFIQAASTPEISK